MNQQKYNQYKAILDGAPDGATHFGTGGYAMVSAGGENEPDAGQYELVDGQWELQWPDSQFVQVRQSLSDLRDLCAMWEREQKVRELFNSFANSGDENLLNKLMIMLPPLPAPPEDKDDE